MTSEKDWPISGSFANKEEESHHNAAPTILPPAKMVGSSIAHLITDKILTITDSYKENRSYASKFQIST